MNDDSLVLSLKKPKHEVKPDITNPPPRRPPAEQGSSFFVKMVVVMIFIMVIVGTYYFFFKEDEEISSNVQSSAKMVDPDEKKAAESEAKDLISKVGKLIVLPIGEDPTIATVTDPKKLQDQAFFANAKLGYKVLIYMQARKAYLYDPERNKLVEVAPIATEIK